MKQRKWVIADRLDSDLTQHLLQSRLKLSPHTISQFLSPSLMDLCDPNAFSGMSAAVERITQAIEAQESIVVWGDFDADGVTSTAIVWETLHQLGANALPYIPNRDAEGHGFSPTGIQKLISEKVDMVITVDHGIAAIEDVAALNDHGIDVIITDHHEPRREEARLQDAKVAGTQKENNKKSSQSSNPAIQKPEEAILPQAIAVVHPMLMDNPQPLAGCGVAYMLAYALWVRLKGVEDTELSRQEFAEDKIELAAIGTIADMVPLRGDNRVFASLGLEALVKTNRPGLVHLYKTAGFQDKKKFGSYEVGFGIGPRLNAPGRLGDALESLRLLCTKDQSRASRLSQDLDDLNRQRQDLLAQVAEEAKAEILKHADGVYVLAKPNWPAGVCGLAAGKIVESYYRPAVVMENMGELSRGSARSIHGFDFTAALTSISDLLESFGGHAMAAGFVAKTENLLQIEQRLSELLWQQFDKATLQPQLEIDAEVGLEELSWDLHKFINQLEPFGMGNPKPVFVSRQLEVVDYRLVGGDGKHLKLTLAQGERDKGEGVSGNNLHSSPLNLKPIDGIAFGFGYLADKLNPGVKIDVAYQLDENVWQNRRSLQLVVKDIQIVDMENDPLD